MNRRVDALLILIKNSKLPCQTLLLFSVFVLFVVYLFLCLILNLFQYPSLSLPLSALLPPRSLSSSSLPCSHPALSRLYFLFRIVGNPFRPSSPTPRMLLMIVTNTPAIAPPNSGVVSVPMTCMAFPFLLLRDEFLDGYLRNTKILGGGAVLSVRMPGILIPVVGSEPVEALHPQNNQS